MLIASLVIINFISRFRLYEEPAGVKLVIDHDAGADDAIAIFMALLAEKYHDGYSIFSDR